MVEHIPTIKLLLITTVPKTFETFLRGQLRYMQQKGFEVHALSSPGELLHQSVEREGVTVHAVEMPRRITPLQDLLAIFQLWQCLRQIHPQIVNASTPKGGLLGTIGAWLAGIPIRVYLIRGLPMTTATGFKRSLLWWSEKVSCLLAHHVFCVSHSLREVAVSEGICPASKIDVLLGGSSNGVDATSRFNPAYISAEAAKEARLKYGIPLDALVVGFVGRIVRDKGIAELLAAWKTLREEFPTLHLLIVGSFEPQDPIDSEDEQVLRTDPRIHLTNQVLNTPPLYAAMDFLTLPTYREGFPNTPLEAAAMRLPVVATRIPGCVDAVQDGVTGMLVPPGNAQALAAAMRVYVKNPQLRCQHGQAGRDRVLQDFNQEALWEAWYQTYKQYLQEKGLPLPKPRAESKVSI